MGRKKRYIKHFFIRGFIKTTQTKKLNKAVNWIFVIFWAGFIFFLSSRPDLKTTLPIALDFVLRKMAHMVEYAILFILVFRALSDHSIRSRQSIFWAVLFSIIYAISDEYHQTFVAGRQGLVTDVFIDSMGIIGAAEVFKRRAVK